MINRENKSIYFWNFAGNIAAAAVSILYLLIVSRLTSAHVADIFSLAYAIGNLWVVIGMFQVRNFQATDLENTFSFREYFLARCISVILMIFTLYPYLLVTNYKVDDLSSLSIVFMVVFYRATDSISDVFQGLFQQNNRLDIAGKLMVHRYTLSTIILTISLIFSKSIELSLFFLLIYNIVFVFLGDYIKAKILLNENDRKTGKDLIIGSYSILKTCFPLFINGFLLVYVLNYPKQVIDILLGEGLLEQGAQRDFSILFMPVFFMSLFVLALRPLITELAKKWVSKQFEDFNRTIRKVMLFLIILGILATIVTYFVGIPILNIISGLDLSTYSFLLSLLVFSGFLYSIAAVIGDFLIILRKQVYLLFVYIIMFIMSVLITLPIMREYKLLGAGISFFITMIFYASASWILFIIFRSREEKNESMG